MTKSESSAPGLRQSQIWTPKHTVWALERFGIRCLIAPSYGDIFFNNCFKNGVLPIVLPSETVEQLAAEAEAVAANGETPFRVDLAAERITTPAAREIAFTVDPANREALLLGLDEVIPTAIRVDSNVIWSGSAWCDSLLGAIGGL